MVTVVLVVGIAPKATISWHVSPTSSVEGVQDAKDVAVKTHTRGRSAHTHRTLDKPTALTGKDVGEALILEGGGVVLARSVAGCKVRVRR